LTSEQKRAGFCTIVGAPNAGKSTLVNQLIGSKISIVSRKAQTTRARLRAIMMVGSAQVVLVDTPGIFVPKRKLDELMVSNAWEGHSEADAIAFIFDAQGRIDDETLKIIDGLKLHAKKTVLVLNKTDLVSPEALLPLAQTLNEAMPFAETFMISALKGRGIEKLQQRLGAMMPEGAWLYPEDQVADVHLRFMAAEITREHLYDRYHDELPYASTVETELWEERKDGSVKIQQTIFVERPGQKAIVLGKGGAAIKHLGQVAREDMSKAFDRKVHLFLFVKVRENWSSDPERLRMMGLQP
jgi:GTPase